MKCNIEAAHKGQHKENYSVEEFFDNMKNAVSAAKQKIRERHAKKTHKERTASATEAFESSLVDIYIIKTIIINKTTVSDCH